jgi:hypothetical protein
LASDGEPPREALEKREDAEASARKLGRALAPLPAAWRVALAAEAGIGCVRSSLEAWLGELARAAVSRAAAGMRSSR